MSDAALLLFALLLVGGVVLTLFYLRYRHSPVVLWRDRVQRHRNALRVRRGQAPKSRHPAFDAALAEADRLAEIARDVSFWNSLFHQTVPGLTEEVLHRELPDPVVFAVSGSEPGGKPAGGDHARRDEKPVAASPPSFLPRLRTVCRFGLLVAKADGRPAKAERAAVRDHLARTFGSDAVAVRFIDPELEAAEGTQLYEADVVAEVKELSAGERRELLALASRIAAAAGPVNAKEQQLLARLQAALGEPADPADPRVLLDIPPAAELTPELIRRKFHLLCGKSDPSRVAALKAAAETLLAPLGAPLAPPSPPPPPTDLRHNPDLDDVFGM